MQLFLSHAAEDARIASIIKQLVERCSFNRVSVWFSSDAAGAGGVAPGGPWFDQLVERIHGSVAFLALVTPTSVENPWLHYEAGCAAIKKLPIIPMVAGLSVTEVRLPLSLYNAHNVAQPEGLRTFLMRLYQAHEIQYDETMLEMPTINAVRDITAVLNAPHSPDHGSSEGDRLIRLVDRRFMDLIETLSKGDQAGRSMPTFSVSAIVTKKAKILDRVSIDVSDNDSIEDVANALYFKLEKYVAPFKYLEQWVVRDNTLGANLIMRDFLAHVKANAVLKPGHEYEVILLSKPYDPSKGDFQGLSG